MLHTLQDPSVVINNTLFSPSLNAQRYKHVNTGELISKFQTHGWEPTKIVVMRKRSEANLPFAKHVIKLEHKDLRNDEYARQIIITNSHDGSCGLRFDIGLLRFACANGLVIGSSFGGFSFRHVGSSLDVAVRESVEELNEHFTKVNDVVEQMRQTHLPFLEEQRLAFAASSLRPSAVVSDSSYLLRCNRPEDKDNNLWVVYNKIQENLLKGNFKRIDNRTRSGSRKARAVKSTSESMRINRELWDLATSYLDVAVAA